MQIGRSGARRCASDASSTDSDLLLESFILCKLGLQLLEDLAYGRSVVVKPIAGFEGLHHVSYGKGTYCNLSFVSNMHKR